MLEKRTKISFFIPTLEVGGIQRVFINLSCLLYKKGYEIDFIICRKEGILLNQVCPGVNLISLGKRKRLRNSTFDMVRYICKKKPDYIITGSDMHNHFIIFCNMITGKKSKVIATQHNFFDHDIKGKGIYRYFFKFLINHLYPQAHKVISVSDSLLDFLSEFSTKIEKLRIYNPFDEDYILKRSEESNIDFKLPQKYILFAGRLAVVKNLDLLIDSFQFIRKKHKDYKLIIAGSGPEYSRLSKKEEKNNSIIFAGEVDHCYYLIKHADVIALTSLSETLPSILIESLILKKTVVSTPTLGAKEILQGGTFGFLSKSINNVNDYSQTLLKALENPINEKLLTYRANAFTNEKIVDQYIRILS